MTSGALVQIGILVVLIGGNGVLAMSEMAIVSSRPERLRQRQALGDDQAGVALSLIQSQNQFLSTIQIGITFVGILAGAVGEASLAGFIAGWINQIPFLAPFSQVLSLLMVVGSIGFCSVVFGELVPKRIALNAPETIASRVAPMMVRLSLVARPLVWLLSQTTNFFLHLIGQHEPAPTSVSEHEVRILISEGTEAGVFEPTEKEIVYRVFRLSDRLTAGVMIPRLEIVWIDVGDSSEQIRQKIRATRQVWIPVCRGGIDTVMGVIHIREILDLFLSQGQIHLTEVLHKPLFIPEHVPALKVLDHFQQAHAQVLFVIDEHGDIEGMITADELSEAILGQIGHQPEEIRQVMVCVEGTSQYQLDGMFPLIELEDLLEIQIPLEAKRAFQTLGGFVLFELGKIPVAGDQFRRGNWQFRVLAMEGNRVGKVDVTLIEPSINTSL